MTISFEGQVVVITGGGGGLGRAQALEIARRGGAVVVNDVGGVGMPDGPLADEVVAAITAAGGARWRRTTRSPPPRAVGR